MTHEHHPVTAGGLNLINWFAGNGRYMSLYHCMGEDTFWVALTILLDVAIAGGYVLIALHWSRNARLLPASPAKRALSNLRNIFIFCGLCGYVFIPVKMYWPAWRLYDMFLMVLTWYTWRYAMSSRELRVVYSELGRVSQLSEDLEKSKEESQRKSRFLNAISHDLRTPLNGLVLQTHIAEAALASNDRTLAGSALTDIKASVKQTANLLDGLLEVARLDSAVVAAGNCPTNLTAILDEVVGFFTPHAREAGIGLSHRGPSELIVDTDPQAVRRILNNLVSNAIKFTKQGEVRIESDAGRAGVEIHVIDTGIGIVETHHDRLFQDFFQIENRERDSSKGFGLGLAIARRLARQLGGDISLQSTVGRGSRFTFTLPRSQPSRRADDAPVAGGQLSTADA